MSKSTRSRGRRQDDAAAWHARAAELADWAMRTLVVRTDRHGRYWTDMRGDEPVVRPWTARALHDHDAELHFLASAAEHVIGSHPATADEECGWGAVDIDAHGHDGEDPAAKPQVRDPRLSGGSETRPLSSSYREQWPWRLSCPISVQRAAADVRGLAPRQVSHP